MQNLSLFFLSAFIFLCYVPAFGQGARNIKISEVLTSNVGSIEDEYGQKRAWVELTNTSYSSYNIRGMYLTTNRDVLRPSLSVPERVAMMSQIPSGDARTLLGPRSFIVFFVNSSPARGKLHLSLPVAEGQPLWIALYNGNASELIDSVSVPALGEDEAFAVSSGKWSVKPAEYATPWQSNVISASETKIELFKREDPHGFAMTIMAMSIVFSCLALLWLFFSLFGIVMRHIDTAKKVAHQQPIKPITKTVEKTIELGHKTGNLMQDGLEKKGIDLEVYMAVIGMALKQYEDDVHDVESGIITIRQKQTEWQDEYSQMTHWHDPVMPSDHRGPDIPRLNSQL